MGVAFALVTAALIVSLLKALEPMMCFFIFFIPAAVFLSLDVVVFYLRSKQLMKYLQNEKEIVNRAETKMAALKERYGCHKEKN